MRGINLLFELKNVTFQDILSYPKIEMEQGKVIFLVGPSGAGKTTLLHLLNRTLTPTSGEISYLGKPIGSYDPLELRKEVLLVPQQVFLFDGSVEHNFVQFYHFRAQEAPSAESMQFFLSLCGLNISPKQRCDIMSGGERQRVCLAIFLSFLPKVLLMDEPTSALDTQTANLMMQRVTSFAREQGISLVIISHSQPLIETYAQQTISVARRDDPWAQSN